MSIRCIVRCRPRLPETRPGLSRTYSTEESLPFRLQTAVILSRAPLLTREPSPLEATYYAYQSRIARALSEPFPADFYFKKGTLLERRFSAEERARDAEAFGEGFEPAPGEEKIEDVPNEEDQVKILPRETEADRSGDVKSLNRRGDRTLYLVIKSKDIEGSWRFPHWHATVSQPLHKTVRQSLIDNFGPNMNMWMVGRQPIAVQDYEPAISSQDALPSKTFFFKARIVGGKPVLPQSSVYADLAWLTKEEIRDRVDEWYWKDVDALLPKV